MTTDLDRLYYRFCDGFNTILVNPGPLGGSIERAASYGRAWWYMKYGNKRMPSIRYRERRNSRLSRGCQGCGHRKRDHHFQRNPEAPSCVECACTHYRVNEIQKKAWRELRETKERS
jgi:hypothetical protein